jgi:hypothetical protein
MSDPNRTFPDDFVPNIQGSTYHPKWVKANPSEASKWGAYRDACIAHVGGTADPPVPALSTKYGKALVAAGKLHVSVTDIGADWGPVTPPPPPPPPPTATGYVVEDWSTGLIKYAPWSTIFSYTSPGYLDCGYYGYPARTGSPEGRVSIVTNPYGSGQVLRVESRDSDPGWPVVTTLSKTEVSMVRESTWFNGQFSFGMEFWVSLEIYLPDQFSLASGGSNPFTEIAGLHPSSSSGISCLEIAQQPSSNIRLHYGQYPGDHFIDLFPLDAAHRNRKITIVLGAKIDPSPSVGWVEAWVDGVNKLPRSNIAMAAAGESGPYWKQGFYTSSDALYVGGSVDGTSILYYGRTVLAQSNATIF